MFNFFANLFLTIYSGGNWSQVSNDSLINGAKCFLDSLPIWNMFNNSVNINVSFNSNFSTFIAVLLSFICCIGVFWMIIKAIRKLFGVFLEWF